MLNVIYHLSVSADTNSILVKLVDIGFIVAEFFQVSAISRKEKKLS